MSIKQSRTTIRDSYNSIYKSSDKLLESLTFYEWIIDKLNPKPKSSLLDIATGLGFLIKVAVQHQITGFGIDISHLGIVRATENVHTANFFVGDGESLPFSDSSFDYITNIGSLEHFVDINKGIQEMTRVIKPNGYLAIYLPNSYYLLDIIWDVWRKGIGPSHDQMQEKFATVIEWERLLTTNGLKVLKTYKYNSHLPAHKSDWKWLLNHPRRILMTMLAPFTPFNLSYSFLYICTKD